MRFVIAMVLCVAFGPNVEACRHRGHRHHRHSCEGGSCAAKTHCSSGSCCAADPTKDGYSKAYREAVAKRCELHVFVGLDAVPTATECVQVRWDGYPDNRPGVHIGELIGDEFREVEFVPAERAAVFAAK